MASSSSSTSPLQPEASTSTSSPSGRKPTAVRGGGGKRRSRSPASSTSPSSSSTRAAMPSSSTSPAGASPVGRDDGSWSSGSSAGTGGGGGGGGTSTTSSASSPSPSSKKQPSSSPNSHTTTPTKSTTPTRPLSTTPTDIPPSNSPSTPTATTTTSSQSPSSTSSTSSSPSTPQRVSPSINNSPSTPTGQQPPSSPSSSSVADVDDILDLDLELSPSSSQPDSDRERSSSSELKKVKVYELRNDSWFDRGTGHVHGLYDEGTDQALLVVTAEVLMLDPAEEEDGGGGGFVKEDAAEEDGAGGVENETTIRTIRSKGVEGKILMHSHIQGKDVYQRQQDTLIVWTEPDGTDIALSFADPDDCENVWEFVLEVQKMLDSGMEDEMLTMSSPTAGYRSVSPMPSSGGRSRQKALLLHPGLGKLEAASEQVKTLARSMLGRERLVEAVTKEDYLKIMAETFENAEDLEVITDLHTLFTMMQTILFLNDTTVIEYILQEEFFMEVLGMLEYDPEFPKLKASYRSFLTSTTRFRQAVELKDASIRAKIHQTYRLLYLKDVVLARVLEESTMNIINSMIFFNQNDIVQHVQANDELLVDVFRAFVPGGGGEGKGGQKKDGAVRGWKGKRKSTEGSSWTDEEEVGTDTEDAGGKENEKPGGGGGGEASTSSSSLSAASSDPPAAPEFSTSHKRDVVLLLHQLLLMSKNIPLPSRLQLVRTLLDHGLVYVLEWAFSSRSTPPLPPAPLPTTSEPTSTSPSGSSLPLIQPIPSSSVVPTPPTPTPASPPSSPPPDVDQIPNAAVEMLTHALDHDPSAVRTIVLAEFTKMEEKREGAETTLVVEIVKLLVGSTAKKSTGAGEEKVSGLKSQLADALKQLLDTGEPDATFSRGPQKDGPVAEAFLTYFYENCVDDLMKPLFDLPDFKTLKGAPLNVSSGEAGLLLSLCDLLSFFSANHGHRSQYFILSGTMNLRVGCLLNAREKPLRHAAIRFFRACLKVNTHFMFRYLNKGDVFAPVLDLVASESPRDNMLSSACLELFEYMRKENLKAILDHLMQHHGDRICLLATRPVLKACFTGLITKWEQNNEPPPEPDVKVVEEETKRRFDQDEDDYFRDSDDDLAPSPSSSSSSGGLSSSFLSSSYTLPSTHSSSSLAQLGPKRKRQKGQQGDSKTPSTTATSTVTTLATPSPLTSKTKNTVAPGVGLGLGLGLDLDSYGDDDEGSDEEEKKMDVDGSTTTLPSSSDPTLNPLLTAPVPIPDLTPSTDLGKPLMDWKRRREEEEEEEEKGGFASLFSSSSSSSSSSSGAGGKKSHKRSGSISSILGGGGSGEEKKSRPLPATPTTTTTGGEGEVNGKEKEKKGGGAGGGFKFSLKPFKLGGGGGGASK
ncbi:component of IIS longevity pathway SMK-1-domain-containing protein [Mrakia frigida]|uniref:Psy2p n=1 Tax=Mrakia frigida TaxID=29902 RepID=UPI003FCBF44D